MSPSIDDIKKVAAAFYGVPLRHMTSHSRLRRHAQPRQMAMALARELTDASLPMIGRAFGNRDHTTVLHAQRVVGRRCATSRTAAVECNALRCAIRERADSRRAAKEKPTMFIERDLTTNDRVARETALQTGKVEYVAWHDGRRLGPFATHGEADRALAAEQTRAPGIV